MGQYHRSIAGRAGKEAPGKDTRVEEE